MTWWNKINSFKKAKGNDYSSTYVQKKRLHFYLTKMGSDELIAFKPFLKDLTYSLDIKTKEPKKAIWNTTAAASVEQVSYSIKVTLNLPATSLSEAKANGERIKTFMKFLRTDGGTSSGGGTTKKDEWSIEDCKANWHDNGDKDSFPRQCRKYIENIAAFDAEQQQGPGSWSWKVQTENKDEPTTSDVSSYGESLKFMVCFANLIHSGQYTELREIMGSNSSQMKDNMDKYALICFIDNIKSDVDIDMGFFEDSEDSIYPKVMSIGLTLHVLNEIGVNSINKNYYGFGDPSSKLQDDFNKFYEDGIYHKRDIKTWPFGAAVSVKQGPASVVEKYSEKVPIIQFKKYKEEISFYPFLKSFSIERKINDKNAQTFKHMFGFEKIVFNPSQPRYSVSFSIVAKNLKESKYYASALQRMIRMLVPPHSTTSTTFTEFAVKFGNLMGSGEIFESGEYVDAYCNKLDIKVDTDMGFFEDKGLVFPKAYDMNMAIEIIDASFEG